MRRVHAIVSGRVQGVSYRAATASMGRHLGVVGWVRNKSDGSVELEVEGDAEKVAAFLAWCEKGPPDARVSGVVQTEQAVTGADVNFSVKR